MLPEGTLDGKAAIVTGGGSGIGRGLALELARLGAAVTVAGRRPEPLAETTALIESAGGRALAHPTDVREPEQVDELVNATTAAFGRVDVLVNNAAGNFVVKAEDLSPKGWRAVVSIVLDGGFLCSRAAGRRMIEQGEGGAILSVIASYAWTGGPGTVHSAAAKAGILAMTRTLAVEWAEHRVRANCICPGPTDTEGAGGALWPTEEDRARVEATVPLGRLATTEEVARWGAALCTPFADYITGETLTIDGGHWLEQESYMPAWRPRD
ncbi:MAG: SDR family oxidoreductase [Gaiellaceae bacterium]|jgi:NAD(P)-dependent dehydrogenase (short-subunit alcohol dehydrogenase family)